MKRHFFIIVSVMILISALLAGCGEPAVNVPAGGSGGSIDSSAETSSGDPGPSGQKTDETSVRGGSMEGTWYEQDLYGDILIITGNTIEYKSEQFDYTEKSEFKTKKSGSIITIIPEEELFAVIDIEYDKENDVLTAHTYPHTDGDGGYHLLTYARARFTPTPEPTYGARKDQSDPDAVREADSYDFTSLTMSFYDEGDTTNAGTDMAMLPPYRGYYGYELTVKEDGSGKLSSDFCIPIDVSADVVEEIRSLMEENDLASINGLDIHTEDIPYGSPTYEFEVKLASGETLRSSADHKDVPGNWSAFQYSAHNLLFDLLMDAGYDPNTEEFHSTRAMKRIGKEERIDLGIISNEKKLVRDDQSYDYELYAGYTVFEFGGDTTEGLEKALQAYSDELKEKAEQDLEKDYELMENATWLQKKSADRLYAHSSRVVARLSGDDQLICILESEGHVNSMGIGYSGYGLYNYHRHVFDTQTGEKVCAADLFTDADTALETLNAALMDKYGSTSENLLDPEIQALLKKSLAGAEGVDPVGFDWDYKSVTFYVPESIIEHRDYQMSCMIYYDAIQDVLSDRYTTVR